MQKTKTYFAKECILPLKAKWATFWKDLQSLRGIKGGVYQCLWKINERLQNVKCNVLKLVWEKRNESNLRVMVNLWGKRNKLTFKHDSSLLIKTGTKHRKMFQKDLAQFTAI